MYSYDLFHIKKEGKVTRFICIYRMKIPFSIFARKYLLQMFANCRHFEILIQLHLMYYEYSKYFLWSKRCLHSLNGLQYVLNILTIILGQENIVVNAVSKHAKNGMSSYIFTLSAIFRDL